MEKTEAAKLHQRAQEARETGNFTESLELSVRAREAFRQENSLSGFAETLAGDFLTLRHLFDKTGEKTYLILAKHAAMASVELAEIGDDRTAVAIPLFNLAKSQETLGQLDEAVETYRKALEAMITNPPLAHNRPGVVTDFKIHLTTCEYMAGDKSAYERALQALSELEVSQEDSYNKNVWLSGGHMRIGSMLQHDDPIKAKDHLVRAKTIIDSDDRLKLRKEQWEKLATKING